MACIGRKTEEKSNKEDGGGAEIKWTHHIERKRKNGAGENLRRTVEREEKVSGKNV